MHMAGQLNDLGIPNFKEGEQDDLRRGGGECTPAITYWCLLVDWCNGKLLIIVLNISDLAPWETNLWGQSVLLFVHIQTESIHAQPELCTLLVLDTEIVDTIHVQILANL